MRGLMGFLMIFRLRSCEVYLSSIWIWIWILKLKAILKKYECRFVQVHMSKGTYQSDYISYIWK